MLQACSLLINALANPKQPVFRILHAGFSKSKTNQVPPIKDSAEAY